MKVILLFSALLLVPTPPKMEEQITFDLTYEYCVKYASHIIKGKIIDTKGTVEIKEFWLGDLEDKQLIFNKLSTPSQLKYYGPSEPLVGWEVILFLRKSPIDGKLYPIKFYAENEDDADWTAEELNAQAMLFFKCSMVFSKNGTVYWASQVDTVSNAIFGKRFSEEKLKKMVFEILTEIETNRKLKLMNFYLNKICEKLLVK